MNNFKEGEWSPVIDDAHMWKNERPRVLPEILMICFCQGIYENWMLARAKLYVGIQKESAKYERVVHVVSNEDFSPAFLFETINWTPWRKPEGDDRSFLILPQEESNSNRDIYITNNAYFNFPRGKRVAVCGGAYGGSLSDVVSLLNYLKNEVHLLFDLIY